MPICWIGMHYNSCNEPLLLADKDAEGRVFQSSLSLGQIGKVIIYLSVFKWQCDVLGGWHSPTWAAGFSPSLHNDSSCAVPSPVLSLGHCIKNFTGRNEGPMDPADLLLSLCCTPKHSSGLQDTAVIAGVEMPAQIKCF